MKNYSTSPVEICMKFPTTYIFESSRGGKERGANIFKDPNGQATRIMCGPHLLWYYHKIGHCEELKVVNNKIIMPKMYWGRGIYARI